MNKIKEKLKAYWLPLVAIIIAIVLAFFFFWGERIDTNKKINDQKVSNYFLTVLSIVGTISAVYYSAKQFSFHQRSILASIRPDIIPQRLYFVMVDTKWNDEEHPTLKGKYVSIPCTIEDPNEIAEVTLVNEGQGIAQNIKIEWIYNREEVKRMVGDMFSTSSKDTQQPPILYLRPSEKANITLPTNYVDCCSSLVLKKYGQSIMENFLSEVTKERDLPKLSLNITYEDIQNNPIQKVYKAAVISHGDLSSMGFELSNPS